MPWYQTCEGHNNHGFHCDCVIFYDWQISWSMLLWDDISTKVVKGGCLDSDVDWLLVLLAVLDFSLRESILRLFNGGRTTMTTRCVPACRQALPVKPQGVWARGIEAWARSRDRVNLEFWRWWSSGPSSLMLATRLLAMWLSVMCLEVAELIMCPKIT